MSDTRPQAKFFPAIKNLMLPKQTFMGRTALVTGGGTGLGKGIATVLSTLGASVAIIGRRKHVLEETSKEISSKSGNKVVHFSTDIRDVEEVKATLDKIENEIGLPTIIVNNAAGNFISPSERLSSNAFKTIIDIVLNGTTNVTLECGKRLIKAGLGGAFLSITTTYTYMGSGFVAPSAAAKAGVETLSRSLAWEWSKYGIRMNCIAPGPILTEGAWSRLDPTGSFMEQAIEKIPVGRFGQVEELANLSSYLLSDYSSWMTGSTILFDGGELGFNAGEFNALSKVEKEQWDVLEKAIRESNKKSKL